MNEQSTRLNDYLFDGSDKQSRVELIVARNRMALLTHIEGLPEDDILESGTERIRVECLDRYTLSPARLDLTKASYRRVRICTRTAERTTFAVRMDAVLSGNAASLSWHVPTSAMDGLQPEPDGAPGRLQMPWCISEDKTTISLYHVLDSDSESTGYAEGMGRAFKATLDRACLVLEHMSRTAQRWNSSIPALVQSSLQERRDAVHKREDFLRVFKEQVVPLMLEDNTPLA